MAKVVLPLLSIEARNSIGKGLTFFPLPHCEQNVVRRWKQPRQPHFPDQGDVRLKVKAVGYNNGFIEPTCILETQLKALTPQGQTWAAHFIAVELGGDFINYDLDHTDFLALEAGPKALWETAGEDLGFAPQDIDYAADPPVTPGEILFHSARGAWRIGCAIAPTDPAEWVVGTITAFAAAYSV